MSLNTQYNLKTISLVRVYKKNTKSGKAAIEMKWEVTQMREREKE